jgi:hypothetical protein
MTTKTTTSIDLGNNETINKGITQHADGTFTAMTFTQSKNFKTLKGAQRWMTKKNG